MPQMMIMIPAVHQKVAKTADEMCVLFALLLILSLAAFTDNLTFCRAWSVSKLFTLMVFLEEFFQNIAFEKNQQTTKKACKITQHAKS